MQVSVDHYQTFQKKLQKPVKISVKKMEFQVKKTNPKQFHSAEKKERKVPIFRQKDSKKNLKVRDININGLNSTLNVKAYSTNLTKTNQNLNKDLI